MKKENDRGSDELRRKAEALVPPTPEQVKAYSPKEISRLLHELEVHRAELEVQNEELRRSQEELIESRDRYSALYHQAPVGYVALDESGLIREANETAHRMADREDLRGVAFADLLHPDDANIFRARCNAVFRKPGSKQLEGRITAKGRTRQILITTRTPEKGEQNTLLLTLNDITDRKNALLDAEHSRQRLEYINLILKAIRGVNRLVTQQAFRKDLMQKACEIMIDGRGIYSAWIALADPESRAVSDSFSAGLDGAFDALEHSLRTCGLPDCARRALDHDQPVIVKDPPGECGDCPLANHYSGHVGLVQRLECDGHCYGVLSIAAPAKFAGDQEEMGLIQELAGDLAFALAKAESEKKLDAVNDQLEKSRLAALNMMEDAVLAQKNMAFQNQLFQTFMDSLPATVYFKDAEGRFISVNKALSAEHDMAPEDLIGKTDVDLFPPEQAEQKRNDELQVMQTGNPVEREEPGGDKWFQTIKVPRYDKNGKVVGIFGVSWDITTRKKAREAVRESRENLRITLDSIGDGVISTDAENRIVMMNPVAESLTGWTRADAAGRPLPEVFRIINEETRRPVENPAEAVLKSGNTVGLANHTLLLSKDGREIPVADSGAPIRNVLGDITGVVLVFRDQTKERNARRSLEESEARFRDLLERMDRIPIQGYDAERNVIYWNSASEQVYGFTKDEAMGHRLEDLIIPPAMREPVVRGIERWLAGGPEIPTEELILQNKQGDPVPVYSSHILHVTSSGSKEMYCVDIDLRDLKAAENELRTRTEEQSLILNNSTLGIALVRDRTFEWVNPQLGTIFGRGVENMENQPTRILYSSEADYRTIGEAYALLARGERYDQTFRFRRSDGTLFWCRLTGSAIDPARPHDGSIWMYEDITRQKETEQTLMRLSTVIEQSPEAVELTDLNGTIEYVNPAFEEMTGYSRDESLGRNPRFLQSGLHDKPFYDRLWATLKAGTVWRGEFINKRKDGTLYTAETVISPVRNSEGTLTGYAAIKRDITAELEQEELFRQAQKMESVGQLAGGIAHDFNNILQAILGFSELLAEALPDESPEHTSAAEIRNAARRGADLTRKLLAFSRKQPVDKKQIDLNQTIQDTEVLLHTLLGERVELHLDLAEDLPLIRADYSQLSQIIINLAVNARDAMSDSGRLTLATDAVTFSPEDAETLPDVEPGRFVCLSVTDTGCGMSLAVQEHLFEPFFTTKDVGKGTGLGLAVIYGIVKQNRGWIHVYSEEGHGSTFKIYLPISPREADGDRGTDPSAGTSILLVEDDDDLRDVVARTLESADYRVTAFATAEDALAAAADTPFDLLFSDIVLPGIDGVALADQLREQRPGLPVLLYSGYRDQRERWKSLDQKGYRFLQKPFSVSGLLAAVNETIQE